MQQVNERKSIIKELIEIIKESQVISRFNVKSKDIRIGVFYTGIVLNTGHAGMAYTPVQEIPEAVCCPRSHAKMPQAGNLLYLPAENLMEYALDDNVLKSAVGIAAINALSALLLEDEQCPYKPTLYGDALDLVHITEDDTVVMVGAFPPFIKKIREVTNKLSVIEKNPRAVGKDENFTIEPAERLQEIIPRCNILIITGVTLVNHTLVPILSFAVNAREIVVVGPTASVYPEPLFKRGVTILGGVKVTDATKMIHLIGEGGSGYDFFEQCAQKIVMRQKNNRR
ncbi:MAG TPA: Rossmann-like domain-containing protein [Candidatus Brocadiaceae bacterium]